MSKGTASAAADRQSNSWRQVEAFPVYDRGDPATDSEGGNATLEQRALRAESLLESMMKGGELMSHALGEASETFGYLHACMFGAEQHLRESGWFKSAACNCQAPPTHMSNDCPIHGLDDERPF